MAKASDCKSLIRRFESGRRLHLHGTTALILAAALFAPRLAACGEWLNCLERPLHAEAAASAGGAVRVTAGTLEAAAPRDRQAIAILASACPPSFDLQCELLWDGPDRERGGADIVAGPHAFGASGYRVIVATEPSLAAECRAPRLEAGAWHALELRIRAGWLEYWLAGRLVVRCPAQGSLAAGVRLAVAPGSRATVRRCRLRAAVPPAEAPPARGVFAAAAFRHEGRAVPDGLANGGQAVEAAGAGREKWLVGGQDATLWGGGRYEAVFGLRGLEGTGAVWLEVAGVDGRGTAARSVRLEELPAASYGRVRLAFAAEAGAALEFRVAAERGRLRVDEVAVEGAGARPGGEGERPAWRPRRTVPLADAWGRVPIAGNGRALKPPVAVSLLRIERRLGAGGWYEFLASWRQDAAPLLDDVAVDLWVACRDEWGIVRVFGQGLACDGVPRGQHETAAWLDPALLPRYGPPVACLALVYHKGAPIAAASRKWGIPVDDVYIVGAQRAGSLRQAPRVTE